MIENQVKMMPPKRIGLHSAVIYLFFFSITVHLTKPLCFVITRGRYTALCCYHFSVFSFIDKQCVPQLCGGVSLSHCWSESAFISYCCWKYKQVMGRCGYELKERQSERQITLNYNNSRQALCWYCSFEWVTQRCLKSLKRT